MTKKRMVIAVVGGFVTSLVVLYVASIGVANMPKAKLPGLTSLVLVKTNRLSNSSHKLPRLIRMAFEARRKANQKPKEKYESQTRLMTLNELGKLVKRAYGKKNKARNLGQATAVEKYGPKKTVVEAFLTANSKEVVYPMNEVLDALEKTELFEESQLAEWRSKYVHPAPERGVR